MTVELRPMSAAEFDGWRRRSETAYAEQFVAAGILSAAEAESRAAEDFARLLTDGRATEGHELLTAVVDDSPVGSLWLFFAERTGGLEAFVYEVAVDPEHRRRGYGRALMEAAHRHSSERGAVAIALHVFGHNEVARRLYDSLGYRVTSTAMKLDL